MQALIEENKRLQAQIEKLSAEKAELENTVSSLKSMMDWFRRLGLFIYLFSIKVSCLYYAPIGHSL